MYSFEELNRIKSEIFSFQNKVDFPSEQEMMTFLDNAIDLLEREKENRPLSDKSYPGALLDFTKENRAVIVIPDLHGRYEFLLKLLDKQIDIDGESFLSVLDALNKEKIFIICVGDGIHSEGRAYDRWISSYDDFQKGVYAGSSMQEEMIENLVTMEIVITLKKYFSSSFHFLKGNHENILNEEGNGNLPFRKFAQEGCMVKRFVHQVFGEAVLYLIDCWEKSLPLCALFKNFAISHAEPAFVFSKEKLINYKENPDVIHALTWTSNDTATKNSVYKLLKEFSLDIDDENYFWIGGHRPVEGKYELRQDGHYIQIHNPNEMNFALISKDGKFDPETNIISV